MSVFKQSRYNLRQRKQPISPPIQRQQRTGVDSIYFHHLVQLITTSQDLVCMVDAVHRLKRNATCINDEGHEMFEGWQEQQDHHAASLASIRTERADFWTRYQASWDEHRTALDEKRTKSQGLVEELQQGFDDRRQASDRILQDFKSRWVDFARDESELSAKELPEYLADESGVKQNIAELNEFGVEIMARCRVVWAEVEAYGNIVSDFNDRMLTESRDMSDRLTNLLDEGHRVTTEFIARRNELYDKSARLLDRAEFILNNLGRVEEKHFGLIVQLCIFRKENAPITD